MYAHKTRRAYRLMCSELAAALPQQIGSISSDTFECPSCNSTRHVKQVGSDTWEVVLTHEDSCLRVHRRSSDPQAN
jgi:ribosomal protein L37AE/L43A